MRISELAQRTGATAHALRHYERVGLLKPARTAGGYRDYPDSVKREVVFITMSRRIGFSLREIGEFLPAYRARRLRPEELIAAMQQRVAAIDAQVKQLKVQRKRIVDHIQWMKERSV
jgi:MerR family copper efflux transcriptional regulator